MYNLCTETMSYTFYANEPASGGVTACFSAWTVCLMASPGGHESLSAVAAANTTTSFSGAKVMQPLAP